MEIGVKSPSQAGTGTSSEHRRRRVARRGVAAASVLLGGAVALTACGGPGSHAASKASTPAAADSAPAKDLSQAKITITPKDRTTGASIAADSKVAVADGTLTHVTMTEAVSGKAVPGRISADGKSWAPDDRLSRATQYRISASARDAGGRPADANATFTTVSPAHSFIANYTPDGGSTVGVGMPVSLDFDKAITDKQAVASHISVSTSSGQRVVGHWFGDQRLDFRPQQYWKPGSKVTLKLNLDDVKGASGVTGVQNKTVTFTVGRSQVSTVDAATQTMTVVRDGRVIRTIPVSTGSPQHTTYNGQMVISEKYQQTRMNGSTVGFGGEYDIPDVPHAMRLSASGTFIHGNYWSAPGIFGSAATSHGCIGMRDVKGAGDPTTNAAWFYGNSLVGDVVIVKNSHDKTIAPDNGLSDWNMPWSQWTAGGATS
ncbi:hypothetical protein CK485_17245 [Streptomyces sp. ICBB 8177]|nr:hypothetical protein CK485_17245 [Streptomyces sp. ICBB 8177]